ncbi:MAG TPA: hypothetical protein VNP93_08845 [Gaiellaceae bacterium]|nr:hypothetical protein [Gaiellaceae bacterium]
MRLRARLSALIAAALTGLAGPAVLPAAAEDTTGPTSGAPVAAPASQAPAASSDEAAGTAENGPVEGVSHVNESDEQPTGGSDQEAGSSADSSISNDAAVGQTSGQEQDAGTGSAQPSSPQPNESAQRDQDADTGQRADANAGASATGPQNDSHGTRVGEAGAGDGGAVGQENASRADAGAATSQSTSQESGPGSGAAAANGDQTADAGANAAVHAPENSIVNVRIEAPGNDAGFDQSNRAEAYAGAANEGAEARPGEAIAQEARANAAAELEHPTNTAVELRIFSDGETAGSAQSNSASAEAVASSDGPGAAASATAEISDPTNTFVSVRVNSAGTTEAVGQETLVQDTESVNGTTVTGVEGDTDARLWIATDAASGLGIVFTADGTNTDLRIVLDDPLLPRPSDGMTFRWTWDLVFGPGGALACAIGSSVEDTVVAWSFDCDPSDEIVRQSGPSAAPVPVAGAISWTWSWLRPDLPTWVWDYVDVIPIPICNRACTYVLDFRWLSYEPVEPAPVDSAAPPAAAPLAEANAQPWIQQVNEASATAVAAAASDAVQIVSQTRDGASAPVQIALQQLRVEQVATAQAVADLHGAANVSVDTAGAASQANRAAANAEARITSTIVQQLAQHGAGEGSLQTQAALQAATTTQVLVSVAVATVVGSVNVGVSVGGSSIQTTNSMSSALGDESSTSRQTVEQEQAGSDSDQNQVAGQWVDVTQKLQLVAAAALVDARNESRLRAESSALRLDVDAASRGTSRSAVTQLAIQLQSGDTTALQQESLQQAVVEQSGTGVAAATGGAFRQFYATAPPSLPAARETASAAAAVAAPTASLAVPLAVAAPAVLVEPNVVPSVALPLTKRAPSAQPRLTLEQAPVERATSAPPAPFGNPLLTQVFASPAGTTGSVPSMTEDAERAAPGASGPHCLAPIRGANAATAGTGSGSALAAPAGYALIPVPRLGRRTFEPAGRRPAAEALLGARPG